jgi:hypothetical protein
MLMNVHDVLKVNVQAFNHMLSELGTRDYAEFILFPSDGRFRTNLNYLFSDEYKPKMVLDGGGRPYDAETSKQVLVATALDIPISKLDQVKAAKRGDFFVESWRELKRRYESRDWYNNQTFALRMRPMLEGSRKSLEGFLLERSIRDSLTRLSQLPYLGFTIEPKGDKTKRSKNSTVIIIRSSRRTIHVQVKGVNSARHHSERAKILAKFAGDVAKTGDWPMPILVGDCPEFYRDIPALKYIRVTPQDVIDMGENLDLVLVEMVQSLL